MPKRLSPFAASQMSSMAQQIAWATDHPVAMRRVKLGLTLVYYGICGSLVVAMAAPTFAVIITGLESESSFLTSVILWIVQLFGIVVLAGEFFCIAVPRESGAKPLAIAAVALHAAALALGALSFGTVEMATSVWMLVTSNIASLCTLASFVCFVLFMRRVAHFMVRYDVVGRATWILIIGVVGAVVVMISGLLLTTEDLTEEAADSLANWPALLGITMGGLLSLVALVMYALMANGLRKAITV